jgi:ACS family hexuronate transporter-like MFS transporter
MRASTGATAWVWWVCGMLLLASALNYMDRQALANVAPRILAEFGFDEPRYGWLELGFGWAFAAGALVFGVLADRLDIRLLYPAVLAAWSAVGFATGHVTDYAGLFACRLGLGFFEAGHWPCALKTTQRLLPPERRTLGNSVLQSGTAIGAILTPQVIKLLLTEEPGSWRPAFRWIGGLGAVWVVAWLTLVRGDALRPTPVADAAAAGPADRSFRTAVLSRPFAVLVVVGIAINVSWHLFRAWLPLFLRNGRGYSEGAMLDLNVAYHVATDVGCLTAGLATTLACGRGISATTSRLLVFTACAALAGSAAFMPWIPSGPALAGVMLVVGAGLLGLFPCNYAFSQELTARHQGKITGTLATIIWLATSPFHVVFGGYVKRTGDYDTALAAAGLLPLAAALLLWAAWPRGAGVARAYRPAAPHLTDEAQHRSRA